MILSEFTLCTVGSASTDNTRSQTLFIYKLSNRRVKISLWNGVLGLLLLVVISYRRRRYGFLSYFYFILLSQDHFINFFSGSF
jgi:hypothetical protein